MSRRTHIAATPAAEVDAVLIGAGHNTLVAAAYLARAGWSVHVIEQSNVAGGAVRTDELTRPGYRHDTYSGFHLLLAGSPVMDELGPDLAEHGLLYANTDDLVTATVTSDGTVTRLYRDVARTVASFSDADAAEYSRLIDYWTQLSPRVGHLMSVPLESMSALRDLLGISHTLGLKDTAVFGRDMAISARDWLRDHFTGSRVRDLLAPWVMHAGLGPDDGGGGFPLLTLAAVMHVIGMPIAVGGSAALPEALSAIITEHGGTITVDCEVTEIVLDDHRGHPRAVGVRTHDGREFHARRAVIAGTTPLHLFTRLVPEGAVPAALAEQAQAYRFGTGDVQIHLALDRPLHWRDSALDSCPTINLTPGLNGLGIACAQARAGLLPAEPTALIGQPHLLDPTRAPAGAGLVWMQLLQQPTHPTGDASGTIEVADGWDERVREAYADRVLDILRRHTHNLDDALIDRAVLSPADLAAANPNWVDGDPYAGACTLDQSYLWRPLPSWGGHETPIRHLWMCGASTYPGPGVNGASGRIVAHALLRHHRTTKSA